LIGWADVKSEMKKMSSGQRSVASGEILIMGARTPLPGNFLDKKIKALEANMGRECPCPYG
jgi:hypothetical protein